MSTLMKTSSERVDWRWSARATSSFPVPFSPRISTFASVAPTFWMTSKTLCIAELIPIKSWKGWSRSSLNCFWRVRRYLASIRDLRMFMAAEKVANSFSFCQGLRIKSKAPSLMARTAISTSPKAVMRMTIADGSSSRILFSQSKPSVPEVSPVAKFMSKKITSQERHAAWERSEQPAGYLRYRRL